MAMHLATEAGWLFACVIAVSVMYLRIATLIGQAMETPDDDELAEAARRDRVEAVRPDQVHPDDDGCGW